jgi:serine protease DegS
MKPYRTFVFLFTSVTTGLAAAFLILLLRPELADRGASTPSLERAGGPVSYADAVQRAAPAVVNVFATKITRQRPLTALEDSLIERFFGDRISRPPARRENSLGSGVIVDRNGYVLTNNHVIDGASEIQVVLGDGRSVPARVVGSDPETDIAVLQAAGSKLPIARLGGSEEPRVGDVVMAIGNPFGVGQTVTMGIVSATGRSVLGDTDFESFIQTDAAINPGNSGGPLINAVGEVVGISTAMFSGNGGSLGIGFAIPVQLAKEVMTQIVENGRVIRGWLGVSMQSLTPALAESLGIEFGDGVLISGVLADGPGDRAGLSPGDLIVAIDRKPVTTARQMLQAIARKAPGTPLSLTIRRGGEQMAQVAIVGERPALAGG